MTDYSKFCWVLHSGDLNPGNTDWSSVESRMRTWFHNTCFLLQEFQKPEFHYHREALQLIFAKNHLLIHYQCQLWNQYYYNSIPPLKQLFVDSNTGVTVNGCTKKNKNKPGKYWKMCADCFFFHLKLISAEYWSRPNIKTS